MLEELFGNQTLVAILNHLNHQESVCASSFARELLYPVNMVQKQLNRLEKGGWVTPVFEGNKKVYYWNHTNLLVKNLKRFLKEILGAKKNFPRIGKDAAYGLNLPLKERVRLCEELTREGEFLRNIMKAGKKSKKIPRTSRLLEVCDLLNHEGASYLIVGGQALNLHGVIRATQDVDVLIPKDRANVEKVLTALGQMGFGIAKELDADEVLSKPWTIIGDTPRVDLMTVANKVKYEEAMKSSLKKTIKGVCVP